MLALIAGVSACGKTIVNGPPEPPDSLDRANEMLITAMTSMVNSYFPNGGLEITDSAFRPRDIDFRPVYEAYKDVIATNTDLDVIKQAKYGAAFSGVLVFLADPAFNALIDEFKYVLDTLSFNPFNPTAYHGNGPIVPSAQVVSFSGGIGSEGLPFNAGGMLSVVPSPSELNKVIAASALQSPTLSNLQQVMQDGLLNHIQESRQFLLEILADSGFVFVVTPDMRGNPGADTLKLDHTLSLALAATLYGAEAGLEIFFARELDLPAYTVAEAVIAVNQSSSFLSLKPDGAARMQKAGYYADSANTYMLRAVNGWLQEIRDNVDQSQDVVKVFAQDSLDLLSIRDSLLSLDLSLDFGTRNITLIVGYDLPPFSIDVDMRQFFENPVQNLKSLSPDYTIVADEISDAFKAFADAHYSRDLYWARLDTLFGIVKPNDVPIAPAHLPDSDTDEFYALIASSWFSFDPGIAADSTAYVLGWDDAYDWCNCGGGLEYWQSTGSYWDYRDFYRAPDQIAFCFTWDAMDFASWEFPNPTANGLLPGMTSDGLKDILTINFGHIWTPQYCDTVGVNLVWPGTN